MRTLVFLVFGIFGLVFFFISLVKGLSCILLCTWVTPLWAFNELELLIKKNYFFIHSSPVIQIIVNSVGNDIFGQDYVHSLCAIAMIHSLAESLYPNLFVTLRTNIHGSQHVLAKILIWGSFHTSQSPSQNLTITVMYTSKAGTSLLKLEVVIPKKRSMTLVKDLIDLIAQGDHLGTLLQYQS